MTFSEHDRQIIQRLARQVMQVASLPVQDEKRRLWAQLNRLEPARPMVWINEIPWEEMQDEELACQCEAEFSRRMESELRTTLYLWEHMRLDMVVDGVYFANTVYQDSGYGLAIDAVKTSGDYGLAAEDYRPVIRSEADITHIQAPRITPDWEASERNYQMACDLLGEVMPVQKRGVVHMWCAPWDELVRWWGVQELYTDMLDRPALVHAGIARMMEIYLSRLDQLEALGLLSVGNGNYRVGSGGLGISNELPQPDYDGLHARPIDQWGTSTGQIFSSVSPAMHDEFCLQYELRWLERFGLNCYGCCEPLHHKVKMIQKIPRLRRVSMSPWVNVEKGVEAIGRDYIFSYKPTPYIFAEDTWNPDLARRMLVDVLEKTRGCCVELIMKDVSTCRRDPQRLWDWCRIAMEVVENFA